jgi:hypothetical protein
MIGNATLRIHDMYINPILSSTAEKPNIGIIITTIDIIIVIITLLRVNIT